MEYKISELDHRLLVCGEGPVWDEGTKQIFWTDSGGEIILANDGQKSRVVHAGQHASSLAPHQDGGFVFSCHSGFYYMDENQKIRPIATEFGGIPINQVNDIIADPLGRIFGGQEAFDDTPDYTPGNLYRIDLDGTVSIVEDGLHISNGMGFNPALDTFYLVDTIAREIYAYDYSLNSGEIFNRRIFVNVDQKYGLPDGMTVDSEGFLWVAMFLGGQICRFDPEGTLERSISLPVAQITSLTFGGQNWNEIFVTSANEYWETPLAPKGHSYKLPRGGQLFRIVVDIQGRPEFKARI